MSVNHYMLAITNAELESLLNTPETIHDLVAEREFDIQCLHTDGVAIVTLTAESDDDPLAFMLAGAPGDVSGWIGEYAEEDGSVVTCEVDMGYGPASYYKNSFLVEVARKLQPWTIDVFSEGCDLDWLEENGIYPSGWLDDGRKESLVESFKIYHSSILEAAESDRHLLVWCA